MKSLISLLIYAVMLLSSCRTASDSELDKILEKFTEPQAVEYFGESKDDVLEHLNLSDEDLTDSQSTGVFYIESTEPENAPRI